MAEIIWSYKAYDDYKNIVEFIAKDSEHFASLMAKRRRKSLPVDDSSQFKKLKEKGIAG